MPKRKASSIAATTNPVPREIPQAEPTPALVSRRSARALPRKNYLDTYNVDGVDILEDMVDREASPDQHSEYSEQPTELDLKVEQDTFSDAGTQSDESLVRAAIIPRKPLSRKVSSKKVSPAKVVGGDSKSETEVKVAEDSDGNEVVKPPTKADKNRARDARAAEKYADFETRPPTFDSEYVPVPFHGRLGYACLNTILRSRKEPVFCSRTTRIATIAKEDKGMQFVLELGRKNAEDLSRIIEWNEKYGIRFFRLSSEMFPFASHEDYLYDLSHADNELRAAGALANKYDHRLTTHPGQFTQIASPNPKVFVNAVRDLEFHNELLTRMKLDPQRDRDAIMVLHLGGAYGDKEATLQRFRDNYAKLSDPIKKRLVLENDDMSWSVTDLLPLCQELNIPLVLDWHHHNIIRDEEKFREGTLDILPLLPAIAETWSRKNIRQKMHISEARLPNHPLASQRRSHSARVYHLPPCRDDMDLMIEAKDKEQAVFELSKTYQLENPPLPPTVVGDGPGAKGDEAYWPEGNEICLKVTKTRVKKELELDSDGNEIKPPAPKKKRVKKEATSQESSEQAENATVAAKIEPLQENSQSALANANALSVEPQVVMDPPIKPKATRKKRAEKVVEEVKSEPADDTSLLGISEKPKRRASRRKSGATDSILP